MKRDIHSEEIISFFKLSRGHGSQKMATMGHLVFISRKTKRKLQS
jgi:hypothetical protein